MRSGVVERRIAKRAQDDRVPGKRRPLLHPVNPLDGDRHPHRLGKMRGDGAGLGRDSQRDTAEDLVPAAGNRVFRRGGQGQQKVHHRIAGRDMPSALQVEGPAAIMKEGGVGGNGEPSEHGVSLVPRAADGVVALPATSQLVRFDVDQTAAQLGFEELKGGGAEPLDRLPGPFERHGGRST